MAASCPPEDGNRLVLLQGVEVAYRDGTSRRTVLRDVTATVRRGSRIAVTGPSGSGKTTLLLVVAGLLVPARGSVTWLDHETRSLRPGIVGLSLQGPSLLEPLTVLENTALPLLILRTPPDEAHSRARDVLDALGVGGLADRLPEELSAGQAQRVSVARALVSRPYLVALDEPTAHLDHATASRVIDRILEVARGSALVVATHDKAVWERLDRRWDLETGTVHDP